MEILNSVKILAERLETHPEEFKYDKKFDSQCRAILELARGSEESLWFLNEQEKDILIRAMRKIKRKEFEDDVLLQLLEDKEEQKVSTGPASVKYKTQGRYGQVQIQEWTDPRSLYGQREDLRYPMYGDSELYLDSPKRSVDSLNPSLVKRFNSYFRGLMGK